MSYEATHATKALNLEPAIGIEKAVPLIIDREDQGGIIVADKLDPEVLYPIETSIGRYLECDEDKDGFPILTFNSRAVVAALFATYHKKFTTPPEIVIAELNFDDESVQAHYFLPITTAGHRNKTVVKHATYRPMDSDNHHTSVKRQLSRISKQPAKIEKNPFYQTPGDTTAVSYNFGSGIVNAVRQGRAGTI